MENAEILKKWMIFEPGLDVLNAVLNHNAPADKQKVYTKEDIRACIEADDNNVLDKTRGLLSVCTAGRKEIIAACGGEPKGVDKRTCERAGRTADYILKEVLGEAKTKPKAEVAEDPEEIVNEAVKILKEGRPIEYFMDVWHKDYVDGDHYGRLLVFSGFCGTCKNTEGLNPAADGNSGTGKTWAQKAMANLLHPGYVRRGLVTPKAGFYNAWPDGVTIQMDDVGKMKDDLAQIYKVSCSNYQSGFSQDTVSKDREGEQKEFPKRVNWWITGVDVNSFDEQIVNRNVQIGLDEPNKKIKQEHDERVFDHGIAKAVTGRPSFEETREVLVCRQIHKHLVEAPLVKVEIPWLVDEKGPTIDWQDRNPRNLQIFIDMIRVSASINRYQRPHDKDMTTVVATLDDYDNAMKAFSNVAREQITKLTKKDQAFLDALKKLGADKKPIDLYQMEEYTGMGYTTLYYRLNGDKTKDIKGLRDRCSYITVVDRSETEYDVEVTGEGSFEREHKKGSKTTRRVMIRLRENDNPLERLAASVSVDRERALKKLEAFLASNTFL